MPVTDTGAAMGNLDRQRWEAVLEPLLEAPDEALWRTHSDAVNSALLSGWLPAGVCQRVLKTDLYDEAMGNGLYPLLVARAQGVFGCDLAGTVIAASSRHRQLQAVLADVRRLPFADTSFDVVVSNSTLDHFATRAEIVTALRELHRVLVRGGTLLLTMDNLANPAVALRNAVPGSLLRRLGVVPYPVGVTYGPRRLTRVLAELGFEVLQTAAVLHCPRVLAVAKARRISRNGTAGTQARFLRRLMQWERLSKLPTRFATGYFIGVQARKR